MVPAPVALFTEHLRKVQDSYVARREQSLAPALAFQAAIDDAFEEPDLSTLRFYFAGEFDKDFEGARGGRETSLVFLNSLEGLYRDVKRVNDAVAYHPAGDTEPEAIVRERLLRLALEEAKYAVLLDGPDDKHAGLTVELADELLARMDEISVDLHGERPDLFATPASAYEYFPDGGFLGPPAG
jgi:hypothetical protein